MRIEIQANGKARVRLERGDKLSRWTIWGGAPVTFEDVLVHLDSDRTLDELLAEIGAGSLSVVFEAVPVSPGASGQEKTL